MSNDQPPLIVEFEDGLVMDVDVDTVRDLYRRIEFLEGRSERFAKAAMYGAGVIEQVPYFHGIKLVAAYNQFDKYWISTLTSDDMAFARGLVGLPEPARGSEADMTQRLVIELTDKEAEQMHRWFQQRALVLLDMRRERHNHTTRYGELEYQLTELNHDIVDTLEKALSEGEARDAD